MNGPRPASPDEQLAFTRLLASASVDAGAIQGLGVIVLTYHRDPLTGAPKPGPIATATQSTDDVGHIAVVLSVAYEQTAARVRREKP